MQLYSLIVVSLLYMTCYAQEADEITVPLKFGESELQLTFPANKPAALTMAKKFCTEKAMLDDSKLDDCLETVGNYLSSAVDKHVTSQKTAKSSENVEPSKHEVLTVSLQIGPTVYDIEYKHEQQQSEDVAGLFCAQNMDALGITYSTMNSCIDPVVSQLDTALEKHLQTSGKSVPKKKKNKTTKHQSSERKITLDIGGIDYDLFIDPSKETIEESAAKFCISRLNEFDLTMEIMKESCADPISEYVHSITD